MYLSLNWLKDFVKIPKSMTPEELASFLTLHTVEVEKIENQKDRFDQVVVGKILAVLQHPNADRLQMADVQVNKNEILRIVCGAPNIAVGQKVPVALIGAKLPNGMEIKAAEVRGEKSSGMLCAPDELSLGDDHSGILILDDKAKVGQLLSEYLGLDDQILEVDNKSITNRPDLWSHHGMARDISAFLNVKFNAYKPNAKILEKKSSGFDFSARVEADNLCSRYMAIGLEGVKIEGSPEWMQKKLLAVGMRPVNNIVDITNYVMLELGQPLHAFDQSLVDKVIVREIKQAELMETLDGQKRQLEKGFLVIADSSKPIAIAGIMGGGNSEILPETTKIIIESANFDHVSIRKTSTKLGLRTESSQRFEKALDPNLCETALIRAVELILQICKGSSVATDLVDLKSRSLDNVKKIELNFDWLEKKIGEEIKVSKITEILHNLGFITEKIKHGLIVTVPTWRSTRDVESPEDVLEEIVRIYGYNNLTSKMPQVVMTPPILNKERLLERKIKNLLSGEVALSEVYNYSFVGDEQLKKLRIDYSGYLRLANPIASDLTMLRQNLAENLIMNARVNQARLKNFGFFEIGNVFLNFQGELEHGKNSGEYLPYQESRLGIMIADDDAATSFNKAKGAIEYLMNYFQLPYEWRKNEITLTWGSEVLAADLYVFDKNLGSISLVDQRVARSLGIKREISVAEISFVSLFKFVNQAKVKIFTEESKYPAVIRDLAFVVPEKVLYTELKMGILTFDEVINEVDLFDVYQGDKLADGLKSLAFHIKYQSDKTLLSEEVDELQKKLLNFLYEKFEAKIRDF
ncbi:MAG: phenylalanine--tRNA ligase subunit beta [bacterium]